jgi:hypothetical protein
MLTRGFNGSCEGSYEALYQSMTETKMAAEDKRLLESEAGPLTVNAEGLI